MRELFLLLRALPLAVGFPSKCGTLCDSEAPTGPCTVTQDIQLHNVMSCEWSGGSPTRALVVADNVTVACYSPLCTLQFTFNGGISLRPGARIVGGSVRLTSAGRVTVPLGAIVDAGGMGVCGSSASFKPPQPWSGNDQTGAGHAGYGGGCSQGHQDLFGQPYGDGTKPEWAPRLPLILGGSDHPDAWLYGSGSQGSNGTHRCCGGGLVIVSAKGGIQMDGQISADGQRACRVCSAAPKRPASLVESAAEPPPDTPCCTADELAKDQHNLCQSLGGASGGTVVLLTPPPPPPPPGPASPPTSSRRSGAVAGALPVWLDVPSVNGSGTVSANGGAGNRGVGRTAGSGGGSGGRVQLPETSSESLGVVAFGGAAFSADFPGQCEAGAAGTILFLADHEDGIDDDGSEIYIDNNNLPRSANTLIGVPVNSSSAALALKKDGRPLPPYQPHRQIFDVSVNNGAVLGGYGSSNITAKGQLALNDNAAISVGWGQQVVAGSLTVLSSSLVSLDPRVSSPQVGVQLHVGSLEVDTLSKITRLQSAVVSGELSVEGKIWGEFEADVKVGGSLTVGTLGALYAKQLRVSARSFKVEGRIQANIPIDGDDPPAFAANCTVTGPWPPEEWGHALQLLADRTFYVSSSGVVAGGAILVCAENLTTGGQFIASGQGHEANQGIGAGRAADPGSKSDVGLAAGSGGGHGGRGGHSGALVNQTGYEGGDAYDDASSALYAGSGGGGANGGKGGGVIHIHARQQLQLVGSGRVQADGADARTDAVVLRVNRRELFVAADDDQSDAVSGIVDVKGGGGGGAGGSVVLQAQQLEGSKWSGLVTAKGGSGGNPGGGGGGGGLVVLKPPDGYADWPDPPNFPVDRVLGSASVSAGAGGSSSISRNTDAPGPGERGERGEGGNVTGPECMAGRHGPLCQRCFHGTYKPQKGAKEECETCGPGKYAPDEGATECSVCPAGKMAPGFGEFACTGCQPGHFAAESQSNTCKACAAGTHATEHNATSCMACELGWYATQGLANCSICYAGTYASADASQCVPCAAGHVQPWDGQTECTPCPAGMYPDKQGLECLACEPGHFAADEGSSNCTACPVGSVQPDSNGTTCNPCSGRFASTKPGSTSCEYCVAGSKPEDGTCQACRGDLPPRAVWPEPESTDSPCSWECESFYTSLGIDKCGPFFDVMLLQPLCGDESAQSCPLSGDWARRLLLLSPLLVTLGLLLALLVAGCCFRSRVATGQLQKQEARKARRAASMPAESADSTARPLDACQLTRALRDSAEKLKSLNQALMWERHKYRAKQHVSRIYFIGCNKPSQPWRLPPLPAELRPLMREAHYYRLCEGFNAAASWRAWELIAHGLLHVLPPLAVHFEDMRKRQHQRKVAALVRSYGTEETSSRLWRSLHTRVWEGHRLEHGCCAQSSLGWLDIFANVAAPLARPGSPDADVAPALTHRASTASLSASPPLGAYPACLLASGASGRPGQTTSLGTAPDDFSADDHQPPPASRERTPAPETWDATADGWQLDPPASASRMSVYLAEEAGGMADGWGDETRTRSSSMPEDAQPPRAKQPRSLLRAAVARDSSANAAASMLLSQQQMGGVAVADELADNDEEGGEFFDRAHSPMSGDGAMSPRETLPQQDDRITHVLHLSGDASYLSPHLLDLRDFLVFAALASLLEDGAAQVGGALNARLRRVDHRSPRWRSALKDVLTLLRSINRAAATAHAARSGGGAPEGGAQPPSLALVHAGGAVERRKQLLLFVGVGRPEEWRLHRSCTLLTPEACDEGLQLPGFRPPPLPVALLGRVLCGSVEPLAMPGAAAATLLLLLLLELILAVMLLGTVCPADVGACAVVALCPPLAGLISPAVGLAILGRTAAIRLRDAANPGAAHLGHAGAGAPTRWLRLCAVWNGASFVNALVGLLVVELVPQVNEVFVSEQPWLLPAALLVAKLLLAQAIKVYEASHAPQLWGVLCAGSGG